MNLNPGMTIYFVDLGIDESYRLFGKGYKND